MSPGRERTQGWCGLTSAYSRREERTVPEIKSIGKQDKRKMLQQWRPAAAGREGEQAGDTLNYSIDG